MPLFISSQLVIEQYLWKVQLIRAARLHKRFGVCVGCQVLVSAPTGAPRLESSTAFMFNKTVMDILNGKDSSRIFQMTKGISKYIGNGQKVL